MTTEIRQFDRTNPDGTHHRVIYDPENPEAYIEARLYESPAGIKRIHGWYALCRHRSTADDKHLYQ